MPPSTSPDGTPPPATVTGDPGDPSGPAAVTLGAVTLGAGAPLGPVNPRSGHLRLRPGELQAQVLAVAAGDPGRSWSSGEIAQALYNRSTGAVGQACDRLSERGHLTKSAAHFTVTAAGLAQHRADPGPAPIPPVAPPQPGSPAPARPAAGSTPTGTASPTPARPAAGSAPAATAPAAPAAAAKPKPTTGPVTRPNGQLYHPRRLAAGADVDVLRDLREAGIPALLYGPPGTGKTSLVEAAFGDELYTVAGDGDTAVGDIVGDWVPADGGGYEFLPGPLPQAMGNGGVLFIDDATLISPKVLAVLYPAMDGRGEVVLKAAGGRLATAQPGFYTVAGHNPGVHGAVLTEALSSRFSTHIRVSTDYDLAAGLGVDSRMVRAARNLATRYDMGEIGWAPQLRELIAFKRLTDVLGVQTAVANLVGVAPAEDRDVVMKAVEQAFGQRTLQPLSLGKQI